MNSFSIKNGILCDILLKLDKESRSANCLIDYIKAQYELSNEELNIIKQKLESSFMVTFKSKLSVVIYKEDIFRKKYLSWIAGNFVVNFDNNLKRGRPVTDSYDGSSRSTKYRIVQSITSSYSQEEIKKAFYKNLRDSGKKHLIEQIEDLLGDPNCSMNNSVSEEIIPFTEDEAIALIEDAKLSKWQYDTIRKQVKGKNVHIFIPYKRLFSAKENCYPISSSLSISEKGGSVDLQQLLNHTSKRLLQIPDILSKFKTSEAEYSLVLTSKWGCDGSSDHSKFKQIFSDGTSSDESIFMMCMVPLILEVNTSDGATEIWRNPQPGSTRHCRPISFVYAKETSEKTVADVNAMKAKIASLLPSIVITDVNQFKIHHSLKLTMIDGKVCQAITGTPSCATCCICGAKPSQMNDLYKLAERTENEENFEYGLSSLHAKIRFMENILHIAYRLDFRKWQAKSDEEKKQCQERKLRIQQRFRQETGLIIDYPQQGSGNSNDGNTARRFFRDPALTAEITGVNENLITRYSVILQALACGSKIDSDKFDDYAKETAKLYISFYNWFYMPASVHKILLHGAKIINHFLIPIGILSEEAQESRNKDLKYYRKFNTRKCGRIYTNTDLLHKLLISSDPYISSLRHKAKNIKLDVNDAVKNLLILT